MLLMAVSVVLRLHTGVVWRVDGEEVRLPSGHEAALLGPTASDGQQPAHRCEGVRTGANGQRVRGVFEAMAVGNLSDQQIGDLLNISPSTSATRSTS